MATYARQQTPTPPDDQQRTLGGVVRVSSLVPADTTPPTSPTLLSVTAPSRTSLSIAWDPSTDNATAGSAIAYELHWSGTSGAPFEVRGAIVGDTTYTAVELRPGVSYYVRIRARDAAGNLSAESAELSCSTLSDAAPSVTLVSPPQGEISADSILTFDVADDLGLAACVVLVRYPDGTCEGAWNGTTWSSKFMLSSATPITGGSRITLSRVGGWQQSPSVQVLAIDNAGQPAA